MKSSKEMADAVFRIRDAYAEKKNKRKIIIKRTALVCSTACMFGLIFAALKLTSPEKPHPVDSGIIVETETASPESAETAALTNTMAQSAPNATAQSAQSTTAATQTTATEADGTSTSTRQTSSTVPMTSTTAQTTTTAVTKGTSTAAVQNSTTTAASTMTHGDQTVSAASVLAEETVVETVTSTVPTNPNQNNNKYVMITYEKIDPESVSAEAEKRADEYVKKLEAFGYTEEEMESERQSYFDKQLGEIKKQWNRERANSIINALGADTSKAAYAIYAPTVHCELTDKQIEVAKSLPLVVSITLQENNE